MRTSVRNYHSRFFWPHITASRTVPRRLPRMQRSMRDARGPSTTFDEALHVSLPVTPGIPAGVRARLPRRLSRRHVRHSDGNRPPPLLQDLRSALAESLNSSHTSSTSEESGKDCSCTATSAALGRVARAAMCANQVLSVAPIPLKTILDALPRAAGPKAIFILQAMAAGSSLCDLIAGEIGSQATSGVPCRRCARSPRTRK